MPLPCGLPRPVAMPLSCGHALVLWTCSCPVAMPLSCGHALVLWPCSCAVAMLLSCGHALVLWACPCSVVMPLSCGHALVLWPCPCCSCCLVLVAAPHLQPAVKRYNKEKRMKYQIEDQPFVLVPALTESRCTRTKRVYAGPLPLARFFL